MNHPLTPIITVDAQAGESLSVVGDTYRVLLSGAQTGGAFTVIEMWIPPGGGPGPHAHAFASPGAIGQHTRHLRRNHRAHGG